MLRRLDDLPPSEIEIDQLLGEDDRLDRHSVALDGRLGDRKRLYARILANLELKRHERERWLLEGR